MRQAALLLAACAACAHADITPPLPVEIFGQNLSVEVESGENRRDLPEIAAIAAEALPAIRVWGGLRAPTRVVIVPDHTALEHRAADQGYDWLRAWARYDVVYLQAPETWHALGIWPTRHDLRETLTHELTHCAMYQAVAGESDWTVRDVPRWFTEGMASWTARQGEHRLSREELGRILVHHPGWDPLGQADRFYDNDHEGLVYSAGHWAFARLVTLGVDRVNLLLKKMRDGLPFSRAFNDAFGESPEGFEAQALRDWRGAASS